MLLIPVCLDDNFFCTMPREWAEVPHTGVLATEEGESLLNFANGAYFSR